MFVSSRMQTLASAEGAKRPSTLSVIRTSIQTSGVRSLYSGLTASLMRQMSYSLVRLGSYEKLKGYFSKDGKKAKTWELLVSASVAGGLGGVAGNPAGNVVCNRGGIFEGAEAVCRCAPGQDDERLREATRAALQLFKCYLRARQLG